MPSNLIRQRRTGLTLPFVFALSLWLPATAQEAEKPTFNAGYRTLDLVYTYPDGRKRVMTTAVWYPTHDEAKPYTYPDSAQAKGGANPWALKTQMAPDASPAAKEGPFPLVMFSHGAFGCAVNSAYFCEYLARLGFVVVAADYEDTIPPDFTKQLAFSRLGEGDTAPMMRMLGIAKEFVAVFNEDREKCLWYMGTFRLGPARFVLDQILDMSRKDGSPLRGLIDENVVGVCGHSLGGLTSLGIIGAHPDPKMRHEAVKAALIFSAPVYPFEKTISNIRMPVMNLCGDNDPNALGPEHTRDELYDNVAAPRFGMILRNANHFTFGNPRCDDLSTVRRTNSHARVIQDYGTAFFRRYLKGDQTMDPRLTRNDDLFAFYKEEMAAGKEQVWGEKPKPGGSEGDGGMRQEIRRRWQERRRPGKAQVEAKEGPAKPGEAQLPGYQPSGKFKVRIVKDIRYYDGPDADPQKHILALYLPEGQTGFPALMFIHGGAWKMGGQGPVLWDVREPRQGLRTGGNRGGGHQLSAHPAGDPPGAHQGLCARVCLDRQAHRGVRRAQGPDLRERPVGRGTPLLSPGDQ